MNEKKMYKAPWIEAYQLEPMSIISTSGDTQLNSYVGSSWDDVPQANSVEN